MTGPISSRATTERQAALLLDPANYRLLDALMGRACSAGDVARTLGEDVRRAHYRLRRFVDAGLVEIVGEEKRAGRPIKRYAMHAHWFVPFELTSAETLEGLLSDQLGPRLERFVGLLARDLHETAGVGVRFERGEDGVLNVRLYDGGAAARPDAPVIANWGRLRLSDAQARSLLRDLQSVLDRYEALADDAAEPFTIGVFLAAGDIT